MTCSQRRSALPRAFRHDTNGAVFDALMGGLGGNHPPHPDSLNLVMADGMRAIVTFGLEYGATTDGLRVLLDLVIRDWMLQRGQR